MKACLSTVALASLTLFLCGFPAEAGEATEAAALVKQLGELRKERDGTGLAVAVGEAPSVYKRAENASEKAKLVKELGKIAKQKDLGPARPAAVLALVELEAPKDAWKEIATLLPGAKVSDASELDLGVVKAAGQLAQAKAAKPLLGLAARAKDPRLAAAAAEALGGYRKAPKIRSPILEDLLKIGIGLATAAESSRGSNATAAERWSRVGPSVVRGLNQLTGQELASFEEWKSLYESHRRELAKLFVPAER